MRISADKPKTIAVCLPGEHFSSAWVANWTSLFAGLMHSHIVTTNMAYSSNVYITRQCLLEAVLDKSEIAPDYVLWIDDDNLVTYPQVMTLIQDLEEHPSAQAVAGWTWIAPDGYTIPPLVSAGHLDDQYKCRPLPHHEVLEARALIPIDYSGFPVVLMRASLLRMLGRRPFLPILSDAFETGVAGEDVSFFIRAKQAGVTVLLDPRVQVPHLKIRAVAPFQEAAAQAISAAPNARPFSDEKPEPIRVQEAAA